MFDRTMCISLRFIWLLLQLAVSCTRGFSSDYSVTECQSGSTTKYHCIGLWQGNGLPQIPCKTSVVPCPSRYPLIALESTDHVRVDFKSCTNAPCNSSTASSISTSGSPPVYMAIFQEDSIIVDLKDMVVISSLVVQVWQVTGNASINFTISVSPDGINWEPVLYKEKLLVIDSSVDDGNFCLGQLDISGQERRLYGKLIKFQIYSDPSNSNLSASIQMSLSKGNGHTQNNNLVVPAGTIGCCSFPQPHEGIFHSGLTISHAVNVDRCLAHCTAMLFWRAIIMNGVHCVCTNRINLYQQSTSRSSYECLSPKLINGIPAGFLFHHLNPVTAAVMSFPRKVTLYDTFNFGVQLGDRKFTVFYNFGDGSVGKTCKYSNTYRYRHLGTFDVSFNIFDDLGNVTTTGQISVSDPLNFHFTVCPPYAALNTNISCHMTLSGGSNVTVTAEYGDSTIEHNKAPDSFYHELGENLNEATELPAGKDALVLVGYPVQNSGKLLAIECSIAEAGQIRFMILRKTSPQSTTVIDQSNQDPRSIGCNNGMLNLDNQSCCTSGKDCQSSQNLTGYKYHYIKQESLSARIPLNVDVIEGDIIVFQPYTSGQLAKLDKNSSTTTALRFSTLTNIAEGQTFTFSGEPLATREMFAFRAIVATNVFHEIQHSYTKVGSFLANIVLQSSGSALKTTFQKPIVVQEKVHGVNITIPRRGLVNRTSLFNVEALGTNLTTVVSFGDGVTRTFTIIQPIQYQYTTKGVFNVAIQIYNMVSFYWMECKYEIIMPVEFLWIHLCDQGFVYQPHVLIKTFLFRGDYVNISTTFSDGGEGHFISNISVINGPFVNEINRSFPHPDAYNVIAFATNELSNETRICTIFVEIPIQGVYLSNMSPYINALHNISLSVETQGGSNFTYKGKINNKPIDIRCINSNCSQAEVFLAAGSYPTGKNTLTVCGYNHVSSLICKTANFSAFYPVNGTSLPLQSAYVVNQTIGVSVTFQNGTDVSCYLEIQGQQGMLQQCYAGLAMTKTVTCVTSGFLKVLANCSNRISFEYRESNFYCMYPVLRPVLTSNSPQSIAIGAINFTLSHVAPVPSNATCYIDFGDSVQTIFEDCVLPMNFSNKYPEGDFLVNASVYNQLTTGWSSTYVKIEEPVEIIVLEIERSPCDAMYGKPGGGPLKNMFPVECPMIFKIVRMDGTRPNVEWNFGDNHVTLTNNTVRTLVHTCSQEGWYNFTVKAFNKISSLSSYLIYECRPSIKCTIYEDSPFLTYKPANITLQIENTDFLTAALIDFGDGEFQVIGVSARKNDFPGYPYKVIESLTSNTTVTHLFAKEGDFRVDCNASNAVSHHEFMQPNVISLHKPCKKPIVRILSVGTSANTSHVRNETRKSDVIITTHNVIDCVFSRKTIFIWKVYLHQGSGRPDVLLDHPLWKLNNSKLVIPKQTLPVGIIRIEFVLRMVHALVQGVLGRADGFMSVLPSIPKVFILGGVHRSEDVNGLKMISAEFIDFDAPLGASITNVKWMWLVKKDNESLPLIDMSNLTNLESVIQVDGCFGYSTGLLPFSLSSFVYNSSMITTRQTCHLEVIATSARRVAKFQQQIDFFPVFSLPKLIMVCKINCIKTNPVEGLSYEAKSLNMNYTELNFEWQLWSGGEMIDLDGKTLSSSQSRNFVLQSGTLEGGKNYKLILFAWKKGNEKSKGFIETHFKTNDFPRGGKCVISPSIGNAVTTPFRVKCSGWIDDDQPFTYRITIDSEIEGFLYSGRELNQPIYLPYRHVVNLKVYIIDSYGNYEVTRVSPQIHTFADPTDIVNEVIKPNGDLLNEILGGNSQSASQLLSSIASVLIHVAKEVENDTETLQSIGEKLEYFIDIATQIPCQLPEDVLAIAESLVELTVEPDLLSFDVLGKTIGVFEKMLNVLLDTKNLATVELIEMASSNILSGIGSTLMSSSMHLTESISTDSTGLSKTEVNGLAHLDWLVTAKRTSASLLSSVDKIFSLLRGNLLEGQNYTVLDTPHLALLTGIRSIEDLNTSSLGIKDSSFFLPDLQSELGITSQSSVSVNMFSSKSNPFIWTPTSQDVATDVISLDLGIQSGRSLKVGDLGQRIQIAIKNHDSGSKASTLQVNSLQGNDVLTHRINVTMNDSSIHVAVHPVKCFVPLVLTLRRDEYDCSEKYDYMWILPRNDTPSEIDPYSFFLSNVELNRTAAGVYYTCVKPMVEGYVKENCSGYLNYTISSYSGSCRYWDSEEDVWKGEGCEVDEHTSPATVYCNCNHLTSFGGGMFVAPNPIDFGKALAGFSNLASNPTVFAVIMSIFALYLIAVVFTRRADLKDMGKAAVTKLPGNDNRDTFSYEITVYTGLGQNSGTTADVYLRLIGSLGDSEPRLLKDPEVPRFQRGAIDKFLLTSPRSLGSLREIHIWHNNAGKSPSWFLFRMQVRDCQTQKKFWFIGNRWLAVEEDDGMVERRIKTATKNDLTKFNILFINATRRNLLDGHLWLSVYTRPVQSVFTRVQRLSCCLSLLLSTMLTNAMFFEMGGGAKDTTVKLGPIQLSWSLIMIGVQSSFIVMPVNVLLVTIFRKLAPREHKSKKYKEDAEAEAESNLEKGQESEQDETNEKDEPKDNIPEDSSNTNAKKKKFLFPYWCIYVAYALCFVSCLTCAIFTIFYGFTFGKDKSEKWLSVMFVSFFQSVLVIQPFKIFLLGLFFALIIKDPNKEEEDLEDHLEQEKQSPQDSSLTEENYAMKTGFHSKPPKKENLERMRALRLKEKQMSAIIREIVLHFLVVIIVLFVAYGNQDDKSFFYSKRVIEILTERMPAFTKVKNNHNFWDWTKFNLIPNLYPVDSLIGYPYMDIMRNRKTSNMVGVGRLRQLRNTKRTCKVPLIFTGKFEDCTDDYTWLNEETKNFTPGWKQKHHTLDITNNSSTTKEMKKTPWDYTSAWEIKGFPYFGKMKTYRGGGYIMELGPTNDTVFQTLHELSKNDWIDQYTRAIFTEINLYNINTNLLCVVTLLYEFLPSGGGIPSVNVQTIKLYRYLTSIEKAVMGCELVFLFLVFYWIYRDCKKITREKKQYCKGIWNVIDSLITSLSICSFGVYVARLVFINKAVDQFHHDRKKYVSFQYVVLLNEVLNFLIAGIVMLLNLKFLRLLRFNRKISMLSDTLRMSFKMIIGFFFMIFLLMLAFCSMAYLSFGPVLEEYRTLIRSMVSLFSMMLGNFNFANLNDTHRILGPLMFFFYMVVVQFVLVNMFIGILCDNFNMVRADAANQSNDFEIVDFMAKKVGSYVGMSNCPMPPNYTWPKTPLEMQIETIDEKTDVIMDYMRDISDEDLRTAIWLDSDKFTNKKDKIILFVLGMQTRNLENDDLFDGLPVLAQKLDKMSEQDLLNLSKNKSMFDSSFKNDSHHSLSSISFSIAEDDESSRVSDSDSADDDDDDDDVLSHPDVKQGGDTVGGDCGPGNNSQSDAQERKKSISRKTV